MTMTRFADIDMLLTKVKETGIFPALLVGIIEKMPTMEIVNCKDCRFWYNSTDQNKVGCCNHPLMAAGDCLRRIETIYSHFCEYGKKKE